MSRKCLGARFDIHTGGVDHIPVHHTNEIAQSQAYLGGPWVLFWLHNEFINLRHVKMSKSRGGALLLSNLEQQGFHPLSYRCFLLASHYRNQTEFTWRGLEGRASRSGGCWSASPSAAPAASILSPTSRRRTGSTAPAARILSDSTR
jgi:cysteinyl-tRNA synthetase